jgi:hypothetical protein
MTYVVVNHTTIWSRPRRPAYITEIQGFVVVVIIWWCDLQLHISYITEIQEAVVVVVKWWCDIQIHMSYHHMITTTTASCISVIHDICSCKSHHRIITITTAPWGRRGRDHMVVWFTTTYVMYYWNTRRRRGRDHMVVWFTTTYVIYYWNTKGHDHDGLLYFSNIWHMKL